MKEGRCILLSVVMLAMAVLLWFYPSKYAVTRGVNYFNLLCWSWLFGFHTARKWAGL